MGYGVKQRWLLAYAISEWWKALKSDTRSNMYMRIEADVRAFIEGVCSSKQKHEGRAKLIALKAHPGLSIKGQVYDMQ